MKIQKVSDKLVYLDNTFTKRVIFAEDKILNFMLNFKPGQTLPKHTHEQSDLIVHILLGNGEVTVDDKIERVSEGDVLHLKGDEVFSIKNSGNTEMSCFVVIAPNPSAIYSKEK